jgi:hypothetical protein
MATVVTLNVFSGRPNPTWALRESETAEFMERLHDMDRMAVDKPSGSLGGLGYRGFLVRRAPESAEGLLSLHVHENRVDLGPGQHVLAGGRGGLEQWLLESGREHIDAEIMGHVQQQLRAPAAAEALREIAIPKPVGCPTCHAADAPAYTPGAWNIPTVQPYNNCYNYANNHITNTFAQPGRAHGAQAGKMACADVDAAALKDGLANVPNFGGTLTAGHGWYVALVIWPNVDYHWYRQDHVGCWSHKPGQTAARNVDNSGKTITDPKSCNRGPYTQFCGYLVTKKTVVIK